ncbi:MAG: hypothetical protein K2X77_07145 [Candidatus Obscuribacterales bacterium]|nr:hypothetical protein [Candidatus Obscuribacterales bacterium]
MCKANMPNERMPVDELMTWMVAAVSAFVNSDRGKALLRMQQNERILAAKLARHIEHLSSTDAWDIDSPDYNRVLGQKRSKKQPTTVLTEYIEELRVSQDPAGSAFERYLALFENENFVLARDSLNKGSIDGTTLTSPDIIVHEEGCLDQINHNLIAIEIKPTWSRLFERIIDLARMKAFVTEKNEDGPFPTYQFGLYLLFNRSGFVHGWLFKNLDDGQSNPVVFSL